MALPTTTLTGVLYAPDGTPYASETVEIRAMTTVISGVTSGGRVPELVTAVTDASGEIGTDSGGFSAGVELSLGQYLLTVNAVGRKYQAQVTIDQTMIDAGAVSLFDAIGPAPAPPVVTAAQEARDAAKESANNAFQYAIVAGASIVASLTAPVPDDGTVEILQEDSGLRVYTVEAGAWVAGSFVTDPHFPTVAMFSAAVASGYTAPDGAVISAGPVQFQADSGAAIGGLPVGWVPFGDVTPDHRGAVGDDLTNDKASIDASMLLGPIKTLPQTYFYGGAASELSGRIWGQGDVRTTEGKRGRYFAAITEPPSALGNHNSVGTAFNGDTSRVQFPVEQRITGASTLGQPVSGYLYTTEAYPHYTFLFNSSGHNESLSTNGGRTAAVAYRTRVMQTGQGDAVAYNADVFVNSQKAGATHWLAQPAGVLLNGTVAAGVDFVYLNVIETGMSDNGHDVSAVGAVFKGTRTQARTAQETYWAGVRAQSRGSVEWDEGFVATGKIRIGLNLSRMGSSSEAAIAMAEGHRIYLDASPSGSSNFDTTLGQSYLSLQASNFAITLDSENRLVIPRASSGTLAIESNANVSGILSVAGNLYSSGNINSATKFEVGFTRVVGSRKTGWSPDTGTAKRTANATYAGTAEATYTQATIQALMNAVRDSTQTIKGIKDDLIAHGLIGPTP